MKFSYYNDDLFIYNPSEKSKGSVELGNIVLDFNNKKELVGIEIINASKFIEPKNILTKLKEGSFNMRKQKEWMIIKLKLVGDGVQVEPILNLPLIAKSPAL